MQLLKQIQSTEIIAVDIETVRYTEHYEELSEDWKSAWEYKNKQDGKVPDPEELAEAWKKHSSLWAEFSQICAVSLAYLGKDGSKLYCKEFYGPDEKTILQGVKETLDRCLMHNPNYRLVGHASKFFDYPFMCKRYVVNNLDIPTILDTAHLKPWESRNLCTNADVWKFGGTGAGSSLQALCMVMGIPVSKVDLVGDEVGNAFYRNEHQRIGRYCSHDTVATFNIIQRLKKEKVFAFDEVSYIDGSTPAEDEQPLTFLQKLFRTKDFSEEVQKELNDLLKKKKFVKKDKEAVRVILEAHYLERIDVMDFDKVKKEKEATNEARKVEIDQFLNTL